jgi:hypothetical protein
MMSRGKGTDEFTELADFTLGGAEAHAPGSRRNVLKRKQVLRRGVEEVGVDDKSPDDPLLFVQRDGDRVTGVDFLCKCGRSASLRLEYDEE